MIRNLAHLCFIVRDLDASIRFYCEQLGLKLAFVRTNPAGQRYGAYIFVGARNFLELFTGDVPKDIAPGRYQHVCFEVDDMPGTVQKLRAAGVEVSEPKVGMDRSLQAWLSDPDGNKIELHQYTAESLQAPALR
jgi:catechol 2,3-dioxygenase-like lactoylglutathione lyase family enzyme